MPRNTIWLLLFAVNFSTISYAKSPDILDKTTDLMRAIRDGQKIEKIESLIKKEKDINARDIHGWTALMYAIFRQDIAVVEKLLLCNPDVNVQDRDGITPLIAAIDNVRILRPNAMPSTFAENVALELLAKGADPNLADNAGHSPLMLAVKNHFLQLIDELLKRGVDPNHADKNGITPLIVAIISKDPDNTAKLLAAGANPNQPDRLQRLPTYYLANPNLQYTGWMSPSAFLSCPGPVGIGVPNQEVAIGTIIPANSFSPQISAIYKLLKDAGATGDLPNPDPASSILKFRRPRLVRNSFVPPFHGRISGPYQGSYALKLLVGTNGRVKEAAIMVGLPDMDNSYLHSAAFDMQFDPGFIDGHAADCWTFESGIFSIR
jgi:hypothetical protein